MKSKLLALFVILFVSYVQGQNTLNNVGLTASTPAASAYSLRKLSSSYVGSAIQVRRSSDDATQNIGFLPAGGLDTIALNTFVGSGNGYVSIWYDQSGNGRNLTQPTISKQPSIVKSGRIYRKSTQPSVYFDAFNDGMLYSGGDYLTSNPMSVNLVAGSNSYFDGTRRALQGKNSNWLIGPWLNHLSWFAGNWNHEITNPWLLYSSEVFTVIQPASTANTSWRNGISQTTANYKSNPKKMQMGTEGDYAEPLRGYISEAIAFNLELNNTDRQNLENNQLAYYPLNAVSLDLASLTTSAGTLTPSFSSSTLAYTAPMLPNTTNSITVTPTAFSNIPRLVKKLNNGTYTTITSGATTTINLPTGTNVVSICFLAPDSTLIKSYKIEVERQRASATWTGAVSNDWNTGSNWSDGFVPTEGIDVIIPNGTPNNPTITAATNAFANSVYVDNSASLFIANGASLTINGFTTNSYSIENHGTITVSGTLNIGNLNACGTIGISNYGILINSVSGVINIDNTQELGILNDFGASIQNDGKMNIGSNAPIGNSGIKSYFNFTNSTSGELTINNATTNGIYLDDPNMTGPTFSNAGKINIGNFSGVGNIGIESQNSSIYNNSGGEININRCADMGISMIEYYGNGASIYNAGTINIGSLTNIGNYGIVCRSNMTNEGEININKYNNVGFFIEETGFGCSLNNSGKIVIGALVNVGNTGFSNNSANVNNNTCGQIMIQSGNLDNYGFINNSGYLEIANAFYNNNSISNNGVLKYESFINNGTFDNSSNSSVIVNNSPTPIFTYGGTFDGTVNGIYIDSLTTVPAGNFTAPNTFAPNSLLIFGLQTLYAKITPNGGGCSYIVPFSYFDSCTVKRSIPLSKYTNSTIVTYAVSFAENVSGLTTANFTLGSTGVSGASILSLAGSGNNYTVDVNTGTGNGTITLNLDNFTGVTQTIGVILPFVGETYYIDKVAPIAVAQNITIPLDASGHSNVTPAQINNNSTDANSGIESLSLSQTTFNCSDIGANNVTLTVTDSAGNTATAMAVVTVTSNNTSTISVVTCGSYTAPDNSVYTTSGVYTSVIPSEFGCDSTITINLTIKQPTTSTTTVNTCSAYTWTNGVTYATSGTYTQTLVNSQGCDSIATLNLTIAPPPSSSCTEQNTVGTNTYGSVAMGQSITASCSGSLTSVTIYTSNTTTAPSTITIRQGNAWNGTVLATQTVSNLTAGANVINFTTPASVTSGSQYTIYIASSGSSTPNLVIEYSDQYPGGQVFLGSGTTTWDLKFQAVISGPTLPCPGDCVSPVVTTQPLNSMVCLGGNGSFTVSATNVQTYQWQVNTGSAFVNISNDATYSGATTATLNITAPTIGMSGYQYRCVLGNLSPNTTVACSTTTAGKTLTVNVSTTSTTTISACNTYTWTNGTTYNTSGTYTQTLVNAAGCDSVATLNLTIKHSTTSITTISACNTYTWTNGTTYNTSGTYTQTLVNSQGCDSVATLDLTILPTPTNQTVTIYPLTSACQAVATVTVASTQTGYNYYLRNDSDNSIVQGPVAGTGSAISFTPQTVNATHTYNVYVVPISPSTYGMNFDGTNDYIELSNINLANSSYTLETQFKTTVGGRIITIGSSLGASYEQTGIKVSSNGNIAYYFYGDDGIVNGTNAANGAWHHVAFSFDNVTKVGVLYLDGVQIGTHTYGNNLQGSGLARLGSRNWGGTGDYYNGQLDDVRIWNVVRTGSQISSNMNSCLTGAETGLVALYSFNEGPTNSTTADATTHGHTGTMVNMNSTTNWITGIPGCAVTGCPIVLTTHPTVTITPTAGSSSSVTACNAYTWSNGVTYTTSGSYSQIVPSALGCDSTLTLNLTIKHSTTSTTTVNTCSAYTWTNGTTYTTSGVYSQTLVNTAGCDSVATLNLTIAPPPATPTLATLTGQCSVTATAPTTTDNCAGTIIGTTTDPLTYTAEGTYTIVWSFNDGNGNVSTANQTVIVDDTTAPVVPILTTLTGQCSVTATAPTTTDNCAGTITGTTTDPLTYSTQGTHTITWTFSDASGNTTTATQNVIVNDVTPPTVVCQPYSVYLDADGLATITAANINNGSSDNCGIATMSVSPSTFDCFHLGSNTVTLTVTDINGNTSTCNATVTVQDNQAPYVATNYGIGTISNPFTTTSTSIISTYPSGNYYFNVGGSTFLASVDNTTSGGGWILILNYVHQAGTNPALQVRTTNLPVQSNATLGANESGTAAWGHASNSMVNAINPTQLHFYAKSSAHGRVINFTTSYTNAVNYAKTGGGSFSGINNPANYTLLPDHTANIPQNAPNGFSNQGDLALTFTPFFLSSTYHWFIGPAYGRWEVDDFNGNPNTIHCVWGKNTNPPAVPTLAALSGQCSVTAVPPTTTDNCAGTVTATTTDPLTYSTEGTHTIHWTFNDGHGNTSTVNQVVTIDDTTPPATPTLATLTGQCSVTATAPTTTDNCAGTITGTTTNPLTYTADGTYTIVWTFNDGRGNVSTANQTVIVDDVTAPVVPTLATLTGQCSVTATAPTTTDNCAGTITGTTTNPLTYTAEGTYTIVWTFNDGRGNSSTANQTVIVDDITAPVVPTLATLTGQCSVTATAPTTTDNCAGTITGTTTNPLTYTAEGTYSIVWTFNDGRGNSSTATQTVIVDDVTAPVVPTLATLTGECSVTVSPVAPTTTDNCAGTITGTTTNPLTYAVEGTYTIVWSFNDGHGNVSTANQTVIVDDVTAPVVPTLATLTGECSVTVSPVAPTTTDNCAGTITGTTTNPLTYTTQGTHTIVWSFNDGHGNVSTANQTVIVDDVTAPVVPTLGTLTSQCSVTATAPTTTDNCAGTITGTTTNPLTYTAEGTYTIVWSFDDGNGNVSTANQTVIIDDITDPVIPTLATLTGQCSVTATAPTTTDNCAGTITGTTTNPLTYSAEGVYSILWTFNDGRGNTTFASQTVIVDDVTAPVVPTLATLTGECSVTATAPTATDNCAGTITGTTTNPLTYTTEGTYTIVWSFNDGRGNVSTANQTVIVDDITAPVVPTLATLTGQCSVTATAPTTTDNCAGTITGTTTNPLTYTAEGTYTIVWSFNDGNGNTSTANQTVIVDDITAPVVPTLATLTGQCSVTATAPTTTDNCAGTITGTTTNPLTYTTEGTYTIVWSFNDGNGNVSTANQTVIVDDITAPVVPTLATLTGQCSVTATAPSTTDNCAGTITGTTTNPLTYSAEGTYTIVWSFNDGNGNVSTANQTVIVDDITAPVVPTLATLTGQCSVTATAPTTTDNCAGTITGTTTNPLTYTAEGTYSILWTFNDGRGNTSFASQTVIIDDVTAPVVPILATLTGQCSVTATAPTATDNCAGTITGTTTNPLTYTTEGTYTIVWSFNDGHGNVSTANQTVIVDDVTAPVVPTLATLTGQCSVTATAPTTTDNCAGTITGTTTNPLTYTVEGTYTIVWSFNDGNGNTSTANQTVIVDDITSPVVPTLATLTGQCSVTATAPTTTDNCAGTITGTTTNPLTYTTEGTYTIVWSFNDGNGNTSTANQTVIVDDNTAPVVPTLATLTGQCSVTATAPTTTDNCAGTITGTTTDPLTYTTQGTHTIVWSFNDGNGNVSTATQLVIVDDNTDPSTPSLPVVMVECGTTLVAPTTTDNCAGVITGTTSNQTSFTSQGTFFVLWTFDDGNGNTTFAGQTVIVDDVTAPIAPTLATLTGQCSVTASAPTATDNCAGTITGTTTDPLTYTTQGTHTIVWSFNDGNGNTSTAVQLVVIDDNTPPTITAPSDLTVAVNANGCVASNVSLGSPIATDNCGIQTISNDAPVVYQVGTTIVTWTVTDNSGNTTTAQQSVSVTSNNTATISIVTCGSYTAPDDSVYTTSGVYTSVIPSEFGCDSTITINLTINNATDSVITATDCSSFELNGVTYTATGIYTQVVTNAVGCDSIITLDLVITGGDFATATSTGDSSIVAGPGTAYQWVNCETGSIIVGETSDTLVITSNGSYAVIITNANGCSDTSECVVIEDLGVKQVSSLELEVYPNPTRDVVYLDMSVASADVIVYDASGKIINQMKVNSGEAIDFRNVERGVYFLHINAENSQTVKRIVKQ